MSLFRPANLQSTTSSKTACRPSWQTPCLIFAKTRCLGVRRVSAVLLRVCVCWAGECGNPASLCFSWGRFQLRGFCGATTTTPTPSTFTSIVLSFLLFLRNDKGTIDSTRSLQILRSTPYLASRCTTDGPTSKG